MMKQFKFREFTQVLKLNGYTLNRWNGDHAIYVNSSGRHISVPRTMVGVIINRLIKENNLKL